MRRADCIEQSPLSGVTRKTLAHTEFFSVWHKCEVPPASSNVRVQGQSGKHKLVLSSSEFDPNGTFVTVRDPAFTGLRWAGQRKVVD
jgi:hypothetical protein